MQCLQRDYSLASHSLVASPARLLSPLAPQNRDRQENNPRASSTSTRPMFQTPTARLRMAASIKCTEGSRLDLTTVLRCEGMVTERRAHCPREPSLQPDFLRVVTRERNRTFSHFNNVFPIG